MPEIRIAHVVSFSSEDPVFKADNLLLNDGKKKWRSQEPGEKRVWVILQLEKASHIDHIDIGNDGSAFVEVQVGRTQDGQDSDGFRSLLVASSFMSPLESRNEENQCRVRMFGRETLNQGLVKERWDRVRVVCTQPFNKQVKYGISFITLKSFQDSKASNGGEKVATKLGAFTLKPEDDSNLNVSVGSWFSKKQDPKRTSLVGDMKSNQTLASLALASSQVEKAGIKGGVASQPPKAAFYQLQDRPSPKAAGRPPPQKLPRRDVMPGESPPRPARKPRVSQSTPSSTATKSSRPPKNTPKASPKAMRPFKRLLEGVIFTISGYQNPLRGELRQKALTMGANYRSDWSSDCSHLICAFANTPKFNQVRGKGKIVKKDWVLDCHADRKRYPWRRFCLDPRDKGVESEEEVWDESLVPAASGEAMDTDEEIEQVSRDLDTDEEIEQVRKQTSIQGNEKQDTSSAPDDRETDLEEDSDAVYDADTDVDEPAGENGTHSDSLDKDFPPLPNFLSNTHFFFFGLFDKAERRLLTREVVASEGQVHAYLDKSVDFVVTRAKWDCEFDQALEDNSALHFVTPDFVHQCWRSKELISPKKYLISKASE
eukprot:snap_masked-scaffold1412_size42778-processed-gene-0.4 protein:Tk01221 transcript:snap_masked-scaffold1412_size42778-processed-gene-0.4-mRNA-1 annotation:"dna repair protein xrcc1"